MGATWTCPIPGHANARPGLPDVEHFDDVTQCLFPGCLRNSESPDRLWCSCEIYDCRGECCGIGGCSCTPDITRAEVERLERLGHTPEEVHNMLKDMP